MKKEGARQRIAGLVKKYEELTPLEIKNLSHNEEATKMGFIVPLFSALGWNVEDTNEVTPEEKASKGRVDYAFKLEGVSQFYPEAKPLTADINKPQFKEQVVTYAYNKGITWAVLCTFDNLRLFNAQTGQQFISLNVADYLASFDKLWLLSRKSIVDGLLREEASQYGALPTPIAIETRLFQQLRLWREELCPAPRY